MQGNSNIHDPGPVPVLGKGILKNRQKRSITFVYQTGFEIGGVPTCFSQEEEVAGCQGGFSPFQSNLYQQFPALMPLGMLGQNLDQLLLAELQFPLLVQALVFSHCRLAG